MLTLSFFPVVEAAEPIVSKNLLQADEDASLIIF